MHDYVTNVNTISISIQKSHDIMTEDHIDTFLGKKTLTKVTLYFF